MSVYKVNIYQTTAKGKRQSIDDVFVDTEADTMDVQKYYSDKYRPLGVAVEKIDQIEILAVETTPDAPLIKASNSGYHDDQYFKLYRKYLPTETNKLLDDYTKLKKELADAEIAARRGLRFIAQDVNIINIDKDVVSIRGYLKPFKLEIADENKD